MAGAGTISPWPTSGGPAGWEGRDELEPAEMLATRTGMPNTTIHSYVEDDADTRTKKNETSTSCGKNR